MSMSTKTRRVGLCAGALLALGCVSGCTTYYKVTDVDSGHVYYTTSVNQRSGSVVFTDAQTESRVSLDSSEVAKISKDEFKDNVKSY